MKDGATGGHQLCTYTSSNGNCGLAARHLGIHRSDAPLPVAEFECVDCRFTDSEGAQHPDQFFSVSAAKSHAARWPDHDIRPAGGKQDPTRYAEHIKNGAGWKP